MSETLRWCWGALKCFLDFHDWEHHSQVFFASDQVPVAEVDTATCRRCDVPAKIVNVERWPRTATW